MLVLQLVKIQVHKAVPI